MCGIAGIVDINNPGGVPRSRVTEMTSRLAHRGPDDEGFHFEERVGLGHRRLEVIDLEGGGQPMGNEDGSIWVVYNGEIYNFKELAVELEARGHSFKSSSDTETLLHAYEQWGTECLERFNGMFAFAIWDGPKRRLFMARDRLGIKPFFYALEGSKLAFASELRALLAGIEKPAAIDEFGLVSYLLLQYSPTPGTIIKGASKLPPGCAAVFDEKGFRQWRWWSPPGIDESPDADESGEQLAELLDDAVRMRLVSDVPLGVFLSGGIDSSMVVAMMARHVDEKARTFQVAFEDPPGYDESPYADLVSNRFDTIHERLVMNPSDLSALLPVIAAKSGEPVADPALIPTYMVSKLAREHVTVALTGEGADELFAGYRRYGLDRHSATWNMTPGFVRRFVKYAASTLRGSDRVIKGLEALSAPPGAERHLAWSRVFNMDDLRLLMPDVDVAKHAERLLDLMRPYFEPVDYATNPLKRVLRCDIGMWLVDDLLAKVDCMSMAHGLEARVPFLDHRLVEWALRLPDSALMSGGRGKIVLKRAARGIIPEKIIHRSKWGFTLPLDEWFRGPCRKFVRHILGAMPPNLPMDTKKIESLLVEHEASRRNHGLKIFSLLNMALWHENIR